jgi:membrane protease YdiL (CAAX protease family)
MIDPNARSEKPQRQNPTSLWLLAVILLMVAYSIYGAAVGAGSIRHSSARQIKVSDTDLDDQSVQDLISVDLETKAAFISSLVDGKPDKRYVKDALSAAESLDDHTHNAAFAARRLIIVRALNAKDPLARTRLGYLPIEAFGVNLPPGMTASDRARYQREASIWSRAFGPGKLTPDQAHVAARDIAGLTNIRWWAHPAVYALYFRNGDNADATRAVIAAANSSLASVMSAGLLLMLKFGMLLLGLGLLIALIVVAVRKRRATTAAAGHELTYSAYPEAASGAWPQQLPSLSAYGEPGTPAITGMPTAVAQAPGELWKVEPEPIAPPERRLTSTDLFSVFLLYMVFSAVLGLVITGFPGIGPSHSLKFSGLLAPYMHRISVMSPGNRMMIAVALETVVYIVGGGVPLLWLVQLARKRRASLGDEIGFTRRSLGINILYGVGGYCIGMPLMMAVALLAPHVFRHLPSPSNPAIPQLISANSVVAGLILTALASIAAPFFEEMLFRGVLYNAIKIQTGAWPAIILSGFVFGFIHPVGVAEMFPLAVLGSVFAWMAETRKSLVPSMVAHCINNLTSCLLLFSLMQQ